MPSRTFTILPVYGRVHTPYLPLNSNRYIELHLILTLTQNTDQLNSIINTYLSTFLFIYFILIYYLLYCIVINDILIIQYFVKIFYL